MTAKEAGKLVLRASSECKTHGEERQLCVSQMRREECRDKIPDQEGYVDFVRTWPCDLKEMN